MNPKRYEAIVNGLTSVARKVLNAVSEEQPMNASQVYRELVKRGTPVKSFHIVEGCLGSLANSQLLKEHSAGMWTRFPAPRPGEDMSPEGEAEPVPAKPSSVVDRSEAFASQLTSLEERWHRHFPEEPMPAAEQAEQLLAYVPAGEEAYRIEMVENTEPHDRNYETYLIARNERTVEVLQLLSEQVDDEIGLALLEIAEEIDETCNLEMEYFISINERWQRRMVLNPGYYQHELPDGSVVFNQVESVPPEVMEAYVERQKGVFKNLSSNDPGFKRWLEENHEDSRRFREAILAEYEPTSPRHEYLDALMGRLKKHVSDIESPADLELPSASPMSIKETIQERKSRRGMCDIDVPGISMSPEHRAWSNLNSRKSTAVYGVEPAWQTSLRAMIHDVGYQPAANARLTRKDKNRGWFKDNVEWRLEGHVLPGRSTAPKDWPIRQRKSTLPTHEL